MGNAAIRKAAEGRPELAEGRAGNPPGRAARLHARFLEDFREDLTMRTRLFERATGTSVSRRTLLHASAGLLGSTMLPGIPQVLAEEKPAVGTYPAGVSG